MAQQNIKLVLVANSSKFVFVLCAHAHVRAQTFAESKRDIFDIDVINKDTVLFY